MPASEMIAAVLPEFEAALRRPDLERGIIALLKLARKSVRQFRALQEAPR